MDLQTDRGLHHHQLVLGGAPGPGNHHDGSHQARLQEAEGYQQGVRAGHSEGLVEELTEMYTGFLICIY